MDDDSKRRLRIGLWNVHGSVTDEHCVIYISEHLTERNLDKVGILRVTEERKGENRI